MTVSANENQLGNDPRPAFFPVVDGTALLAPPEDRLGQSVRFAARSLSVMQKEGLAASTANGQVWRLVSDEGAYLDGHDEAPCPLSFLTVGMVSSFMTEILALAAMRQVDLGSVELVQDNFYTMQGSALKGTMTGGARDVQLVARIGGAVDAGVAQALVLDAVAASPLNGLLRGELASLFSLSLNGEAIRPDRARAVERARLGNPTDVIARAVPASEAALLARAGPSPLTDEATSHQGSSLAELQDRVLHIRGICRVRPDGVKEIEQQLFNPHGSIFHFKCDEQGRAPDAASYVAAGIGFCFMTQLGRYARIAGKQLAAYDIVQDLHFSRGGASGGTGQAGTALPVETHVFLTTEEDANFARSALDMGEQTCFLHALCRTDLRVRVRVELVPGANRGA